MPKPAALLIILGALALAAFVCWPALEAERARHRLILIDIPAPNDGVLATSGPCRYLGGLARFNPKRPLILVTAVKGREDTTVYAAAMMSDGRFFVGPPTDQLPHLTLPLFEGDAVRALAIQARANLGNNPTCIILRADQALALRDVMAMAQALRQMPDTQTVFFPETAQD